MRSIPKLVVLFVAALQLPKAQTASPSDTNLVFINVQAVDRQGHFVPDLCGHFRLFEDGSERRIQECTSESAPVATAIVLDASDSMAPFLNASKAAIRTFLQTAGPEDEFSLTLVRDTPKPELNFSSKPELVLNHVDQAAGGGLTALRDSVYLAARQLKTARYPGHAMLVISDGDDNNSRYSSSDVRSILWEAGIPIYSIGVHSGSSRTMAARLYYLQDLAKETGGRYFDAYTAGDFRRIMENLNTRNRYVLEYSPSSARAGSTNHRIRVNLEKLNSRMKPSLAWQRGYVAPSSQ